MPVFPDASDAVHSRTATGLVFGGKVRPGLGTHRIRITPTPLANGVFARPISVFNHERNAIETKLFSAWNEDCIVRLSARFVGVGPQSEFTVANCNGYGYSLSMTSDFAIALHILGFLTSRGGGPLTSDQMAHTYGTNAVVIRRVQSKLKKAGLIETRCGVGGGCVLARQPENINLRDAYEAVTPEPQLLARHPMSCEEAVPIVMGNFVNEVCADAEQALLERLQTITIRAMDKTIRTRIRKTLRASRDARSQKAAS